jgi:hypothetical protein
MPPKYKSWRALFQHGMRVLDRLVDQLGYDWWIHVWVKPDDFNDLDTASAR